MNKSSKILVSKDFYGGGSGIDDILNDYYEREIRKIGNKEEQDLARRFIEEGLIIDGNRVSVSEAAIISQYSIPEPLLLRLKESRIIRSETTHLGKAYEVSHDTLVLPILKSFEKRRAVEERIAFDRKLKEDQLALAIEMKKKRRALLLAGLGFLLFFIALIALAIAFKLNRETNQQRKIAKSNALTAHSIFETQKNNNVTKGFGLAKTALVVDDNTEARKGLFSVYYKAVGPPANYFYIRDLNCQKSNLLSAYYSPLANYIMANAWNRKACLMDKDGILLHTFNISAEKPRKRSFFSPDEKYLLTLSEQKTAEIWDLKSLTDSSVPIAILEGHSQTLTGAAFSSDGQKILTYASGDKALLWNSEWTLEKEIIEPGQNIIYANFSLDGQRILTINEDGTFQIRNEEGAVLKTMDQPHGRTFDVCFSPDSAYFVIASGGKIIHVWDWNGQLITELRGHTDFIRDLDWSPDGSHIASASPDKTAKIWDLKGNIVANIDGHHATVLSVNFSPDGTNLLTSSVDNTASVWTIQGEVVANLAGHFEKVSTANYSPDGKRILTFSENDNTIKVWIKKKKHTANLPVASEEAFKGKFSSDGKKAVTCGSSIAMLWDVSEGYESAREIAQLTEHSRGVNYVSFSPDGNLVATASLDHTAKIWNLKGKMVADLIGHNDQLERVQWSPDNQQLITASHDSTAKVWSLSGDLLFTLKGHKGPVLFAAFSPDGKQSVTTSADNTVKVWDREGNLIATLTGHKHMVVDAEFSPTGDYLATASEDDTGRIWDLRDGADFGKSTILSGHSDGLKTVDVSPDGQYIVTASEDRTAKVWTRNGSLMATLIGHESRLTKAIFSFDGKWIATTSSDNTAKVWNIDGLMVSDMIGHENSVNDVNFSPDNAVILTAGSDQQAMIWPILTIEELISKLDKHGVIELNDDMKRKYKVDEE